MFLKMHEPSNYHSYLAAIEARCELEDTDRSMYFSYKNGVEGEQQFFEFLSRVGGLKLWDVMLNVKGQVQYDFLVIYNGRVFHFDVKNFVGNYQFVDGNFVSPGGYVHKDVIPQLDRAHYKLNEFLRGTGYVCQSRIVFVNEQFHVRGYYGDKKVLFRSGLAELQSYFNSAYEASDADLKIAAMLLDAHQPKEFQRIHYYPFETLAPGVRCPKCRTIGMKKEKHSKLFSCKCCGHQLKTNDAVQSTVKEMSILKNAPLKTSEVMEWTGLCRATARRVLSKSCNKSGTYTDAKYVLK